MNSFKSKCFNNSWKFISLIIFLGGGAYIFKLNRHVLRLYDESIYALTAQQMVTEGYHIIPHIYWESNGLTPFLQKPPLAIWLQGISMSVFGFNEGAARLPSVFASILLAILVFKIGAKLYEWRIGLAAAFILLAMPTMYIAGHSGRRAVLDVPLVLFGSLFVWLVWRAKSSPKFFIPAGIAGGLAVLTKGIAAGTFLFVIAPIVISNYREYIMLDAFKGGLIGSLVILPWNIYVYLHYPNEYIEQMILRQVKRSAGIGPFSNSSDAIFQFMNFPYFEFALLSPKYGIFVSVAIIYSIIAILKDLKYSNKLPFLVWWTIVPPVLFAIVGGNHGWYLLPMVVPVALILGHLVISIVDYINTVSRNELDINIISTRVFIGLVIISFLVVVSIYIIVDPVGAGPVNQQAIAEEFENVPKTETIYIGSEAFDRRHWPFAFYVNQPITGGSINNLNDNCSIRYALIDEKNKNEITRDYIIYSELEGHKQIVLQLTRHC